MGNENKAAPEPLVIYCRTPRSLEEDRAMLEHAANVHRETGRYVVLSPISETIHVSTLNRMVALEDACKALVAAVDRNTDRVRFNLGAIAVAAESAKKALAMPVAGVNPVAACEAVSNEEEKRGRCTARECGSCRLLASGDARFCSRCGSPFDSGGDFAAVKRDENGQWVKVEPPTQPMPQWDEGVQSPSRLSEAAAKINEMNNGLLPPHARDVMLKMLARNVVLEMFDEYCKQMQEPTQPIKPGDEIAPGVVATPVPLTSPKILHVLDETTPVSPEMIAKMKANYLSTNSCGTNPNGVLMPFIADPKPFVVDGDDFHEPTLIDKPK